MVDAVEGDEEVWSLPEGLEGGEDVGFAGDVTLVSLKYSTLRIGSDFRGMIRYMYLQSGIPYEFLMRNAVAMIHASFHMGGQMLLGPGGRVVAVEAQREALEPFGHLFDVMIASFFWDGSFYDGETITGEVIAEVTVLLLGSFWDWGGRFLMRHPK